MHEQTTKVRGVLVEQLAAEYARLRFRPDLDEEHACGAVGGLLDLGSRLGFNKSELRKDAEKYWRGGTTKEVGMFTYVITVENEGGWILNRVVIAGKCAEWDALACYAGDLLPEFEKKDLKPGPDAGSWTINIGDSWGKAAGGRIVVKRVV